MLVNPLLGVDRRNLRECLRRMTADVGNLRSFSGTAGDWLIAYLTWASEAARQLRTYVRAEDIDGLVFTEHYRALLTAGGTDLAGRAGGRVVNGLLSLELDARAQAFEEASAAVEQQIGRWSGPGVYVVCDSNFYLHHPKQIDYVDFHQLIADAGLHAAMVGARRAVNLLIPTRVIAELDRAKMSGKDVRTRARTTLKTIDDWFEKPDAIHYVEPKEADGPESHQLTAELLIDPVGHVPLDVADDEIIDRVATAQPLAGRDIILITYDTTMSTKARHTGLKVIKLTHM